MKNWMAPKRLAITAAISMLATAAYSQTASVENTEAAQVPPPAAVSSLTIKRIYFGPGGNTMAGQQLNTNNAIRDQFRILQRRWIRVDVSTVGQTFLCPVGQWAWIAEYGDDGPRTYFTIICAAKP